MSEPDIPPTPEDQLMREAAGWFARMRGPDADASREEFEAWLRRGALHRGAYNRAAEIFAMGKLLGEEPAIPSRPEHRRRRVAIAVVTAALAALALMLLFTPGLISFGGADNRQSGAEQIARPPLVLIAPSGKARAFDLADGSTVTLEGGSSLEVQLGATERRLDLTRGRARFDVFHEGRPFVVHAGGGTVTARGTRFEVALGENRQVTVRLIEGTVDVSLPPAKGRAAALPAVRRLRAGMALSFAAAPEASHSSKPGGTSSATPSPAVGAAPAGAARDFEAVTVAELVAEANRTSSRPIRLGNEAIGRRKVSGRFRVDDSIILAERLAILFDLGVDLDDPREIVLRAR